MSRWCRDGVAERRADIVACEVQTCDDGEVLVERSCLDRHLCRIGEHTACQAQQDLGADDARLARGAGGPSVVD